MSSDLAEKCVVFGCRNHRGEGQFVGELCAPCYGHITTGKVGPTASFLGDLTAAAKANASANDATKAAAQAYASALAEEDAARAAAEAMAHATERALDQVVRVFYDLYDALPKPAQNKVRHLINTTKWPP